MQVSENKISIKDAIVVTGFCLQIAVTYGVITTKLDNYEENQRKLERTIERMDAKIEAFVLEIYRNRQNRVNRD
jgi:hypothetical protein